MIGVNTFALGQADDLHQIPAPLLGQIVIFLTTIAGFAYNLYRESRQRKWDLEDRRRARQEIHQKVEEKADDVSRKVTTELAAQTEEVVNRIDENTAVTAAAAQAAIETKAVTEKKLEDLRRLFEGQNGH